MGSPLSINDSILDSVHAVVDGQSLGHDRPKGLLRGKKSSDLQTPTATFAEAKEIS